MAASRSGVPTPPSDHNDPDHAACPVCGWRPCTRTCRFGLREADLRHIEAIASGLCNVDAETGEDEVLEDEVLGDDVVEEDG